MTTTPVSKPERPSASREEEDRRQRHGHRTAVFDLKRFAPVAEKRWVQPDLPVGAREHYDVE